MTGVVGFGVVGVVGDVGRVGVVGDVGPVGEVEPVGEVGGVGEVGAVVSGTSGIELVITNAYPLREISTLHSMSGSSSITVH